MSNWLFLMLLYAFFGWMKKKQRDKAREKIESQEGWDTGDFVEFGEGILESIIGDGDEREERIIDEKVDIADQDLIEATNHVFCKFLFHTGRGPFSVAWMGFFPMEPSWSISRNSEEVKLH